MRTCVCKHKLHKTTYAYHITQNNTYNQTGPKTSQHNMQQTPTHNHKQFNHETIQTYRHTNSRSSSFDVNKHFFMGRAN